MAYVNMTLDGQTKRTDSIKLVGADDVSKNAILSAVLEESDSVPSGGVETGIATGNGTDSMAIDTEKNHILCAPNGLNDTVLAGVKCIVFFYMDKEKNLLYVAPSSSGGTSTNAMQSTTCDNTIALVRHNNGLAKAGTGYVFADTKEYVWFAW